MKEERRVVPRQCMEMEDCISTGRDEGRGSDEARTSDDEEVEEEIEESPLAAVSSSSVVSWCLLDVAKGPRPEGHLSISTMVHLSPHATWTG
jgi:hypothetical protein